MRDPEPTGPGRPGTPLDATVRLTAGEPAPPSAATTQQLRAGGPEAPAPEATVQLPAGEPLAPSAQSTQRLPAGEPVDSGSTQRLVLPLQPEADRTVRLTLPPLEPADQTQKLTLPRPGIPPVLSPTPAPPGPDQRRSVLPWKVPAALGALLVIGAVVYGLFFRRPAAPVLTTAPPPTTSAPTSAPATPIPAAARPEEPVPAALRPYLDKAEAGDAKAMHMLGTRYLQGLDVPRDRAKGLAWLHKAADHGSEAAKAELKTLEQGGQ